MATDTGDSKKSCSFAPRSPQIEAERRPVRASILFITLGLALTVVTVLWLGAGSVMGWVAIRPLFTPVEEL